MDNSIFNISSEILQAEKKAMELCKDTLEEIDRIQEYNQQKMIKACLLYTSPSPRDRG